MNTELNLNSISTSHKAQNRAVEGSNIFIEQIPKDRMKGLKSSFKGLFAVLILV